MQVGQVERTAEALSQEAIWGPCIMRCSPVHVYVFDQDGWMVYANKSAKKCLTSPGDLLHTQACRLAKTTAAAK